MSLRECTVIAIRNIKLEKKMSLKIIIGLALIIMLLFSVITYWNIFSQQKKDIIEKHKSNCYFYKLLETEQLYNYENTEPYNKYKQFGIEEVSFLNKLYIYADNKEAQLDNEDDNHILIENSELIIEGNTYKGKKEWQRSTGRKKELYEIDELRFATYFSEFVWFPAKVISQFQKEKKQEPYLTGKLPEKEGDILISDYILKCFGIEEKEQSLIIGKNISICLKEQKNKLVLENYKITGIFDADILDVRERNSLNPHFEQIGVILKNSDKKRAKLYGMNEIRYYCKNYIELQKIQNEIKKKGEDVALSFYADIYIFFNKEIHVINIILTYIIIGFVIAVVVYITSIIYFFFQKTKKYFMTLIAIGMRNKYIYSIVSWEILFLVSIAAIIGIYFAVIGLLGIQILYRYSMNLQLELKLPTLIIAGVLSFFCCFGVFFIEGFVFCKQLIREKITNILR
ncbi:MAG: ABC transporter permease [Clostridiales bacterium]|nr:ABC transporter permease [Clostridiales bacterium]